MSAAKGFTKAPNKLLFHSNLSPIAKLVMVGLSYYDRGRGAFCKRETLARMLNVSLYQLRRALQELVEAELIVIHKRGYGKTSIIRVVENTKTIEVPKTTTHNKRLEEEVIEEEFVSKTSEDDVENNNNKQEEQQEEPTRPQTGHTATNEVKPLPIHKDTTDALLRAINERIRPKSYSVWFHNKIAVSYEDDTAMTIRCLDTFTAKWLQEHYSQLVEEIVTKSIVFHGKEIQNGQEEKYRHRKFDG